MKFFATNLRFKSNFKVYQTKLYSCIVCEFWQIPVRMSSPGTQFELCIYNLWPYPAIVQPKFHLIIFFKNCVYWKWVDTVYCILMGAVVKEQYQLYNLL